MKMACRRKKKCCCYSCPCSPQGFLALSDFWPYTRHSFGHISYLQVWLEPRWKLTGESSETKGYTPIHLAASVDCNYSLPAAQ